LLAQTGGDGLLDVAVDLLAIDVLVAGDAVDDANQFLGFMVQACNVRLPRSATKKADPFRRPASARQRRKGRSADLSGFLRAFSRQLRQTMPMRIKKVHGQARGFQTKSPDSSSFRPLEGSKNVPWPNRQSPSSANSAVIPASASTGRPLRRAVPCHINIHVTAQRLNHVDRHLYFRRRIAPPSTIQPPTGMLAAQLQMLRTDSQHHPPLMPFRRSQRRRAGKVKPPAGSVNFPPETLPFHKC
jgi:hypothetical protein